MSENRRYYWIKLKDSFMTSDAVDFLMSQKDGAKYVVLYQMLCLMVIKSEGRLERRLGEVIIHYDVDKIQRDTKYFGIDTIKIALELFKKLGLIYHDENECLKISGYEALVGSETASAERSRKSRTKVLQCNKNATLLQQNCNKNATLLQQKCNTDIDIEKDKEKDKDLEKEKIKKEKESITLSAISADTRGHKTEMDTEIFNADRAFDKFWKRYPRKDAKTAGCKAFKRACKNGRIFADVMTGLESQNKFKFSVTDKKYIPYAATWLNQERWKDEVKGDEHEKHCRSDGDDNRPF